MGLLSSCHILLSSGRKSRAYKCVNRVTIRPRWSKDRCRCAGQAGQGYYGLARARGNSRHIRGRGAGRPEYRGQLRSSGTAGGVLVWRSRRGMDNGRRLAFDLSAKEPARAPSRHGSFTLDYSDAWPCFLATLTAQTPMWRNGRRNGLRIYCTAPDQLLLLGVYATRSDRLRPQQTLITSI